MTSKTYFTIEVIRRFWSRAVYRFMQFKSVMRPKVDDALFAEATAKLPQSWQEIIFRLLPSEKAHILRMYNKILTTPNITGQTREELIILALTHDLGKVITRPSVFERIIKTIIPIPNRAHPILSARILKRLGAPPLLIERVRQHHENPGEDKLLALFQTFDDNL